MADTTDTTDTTETLASLNVRRYVNWQQTPQNHLGGADDAIPLINKVGIATLYPASPEIPNLYHAYVGNPEAKTEQKWDSPSGQVYSWRWTLGRKGVAFYGVLVRKRPTLVSWEMLPAALRLFGDLRMPDELYDLGVISAGAYRIVQALEAAGGTMSTGPLRDAAGFPTGREQRSAFLKALDELDTRLLIGKHFAAEAGDDDAYHALIYMRYREYVDAAERLTAEQALETLLLTYLPHAVYAIPTVLARHLRMEEATLRAGLDRLVEAGRARPATIAGVKGKCYVWVG